MSAAIPVEAVIGCVIYSSTEILSPGVIRHVEGTRFTMGEPGRLDQRPLHKLISAAFVAGGLKSPGRRRTFASRSG